MGVGDQLESSFIPEQLDDLVSDFLSDRPGAASALAWPQSDVAGQKILLAVGDGGLRRQLNTLLTKQGAVVHEVFGSIEAIAGCVPSNSPRLMILESPWPDGLDSMSAAKAVLREDRRLPVILVTRQGSKALVIAALKTGLKDYFEVPFRPDELLMSVQRCLTERSLLPAKRNTPITYQTPLRGSLPQTDFIGESHVIKKVRTNLQKIARVDSHALITGETGTGKEVTALYIHQNSLRSDKAFVAINCAAIPDSLLESELFGYEKGAFTGANFSYAGKLKLADGGTVFLDEIGDMTPYAQAKILRMIESKEIYPLGAKRTVPLDIRLIAATNRNLEQLVAKNEFRQDLYFRLNVARVQLPPLRERKEDIHCLIKHFVQTFNDKFGCEITGFTDEAWSFLVNYEWPGNVRELKNFIESLYIDPPSDGCIAYQDLPEYILAAAQPVECDSSSERDLLISTLNDVNWNKSKAAEKLQWSRMTLYRKLAKFNIQ